MDRTNLIIISIILVLCLIVYVKYIQTNKQLNDANDANDIKETYRSCCWNGCGNSCSGNLELTDKDVLIVNPFKRPQSSTMCPEEERHTLEQFKEKLVSETDHEEYTS